MRTIDRNTLGIFVPYPADGDAEIARAFAIVVAGPAAGRAVVRQFTHTSTGTVAYTIIEDSAIGAVEVPVELI
jgi:hypothetical protein